MSSKQRQQQPTLTPKLDISFHVALTNKKHKPSLSYPKSKHIQDPNTMHHNKFKDLLGI